MNKEKLTSILSNLDPEKTEILKELTTMTVVTLWAHEMGYFYSRYNIPVHESWKMYCNANRKFLNFLDENNILKYSGCSHDIYTILFNTWAGFPRFNEMEVYIKTNILPNISKNIG